MFNKRGLYLGIILIFLTSYTSCVNLQHVNRFATSSVDVLSHEDDIGYSFTQHCLDFKCKEIYHIPTNFSKDFGEEPMRCDCDTFKMADKTLVLFNNVLTAYLTGLANLSDNQAVNYNFDNLIKAVDVDQIKDKLQITKSDISSLGKLATIISNDLMDLYRKRKLKDIIKKSNSAFDTVISAYRKCMNNYYKNIVLEGDYRNLSNLYTQYFKNNETLLSPIEKARIYEEYLTRRETFARYKGLSERFISALDEIKDGHNKLNEEADHLTRKDLKELVSKYATDIDSFMSEFNKLKKSNQK
jgi:hypothetical protein